MTSSGTEPVETTRAYRISPMEMGEAFYKAGNNKELRGPSLSRAMLEHIVGNITLTESSHRPDYNNLDHDRHEHTVVYRDREIEKSRHALKSYTNQFALGINRARNAEEPNGLRHAPNNPSLFPEEKTLDFRRDYVVAMLMRKIVTENKFFQDG